MPKNKGKDPFANISLIKKIYFAFSKIFFSGFGKTAISSDFRKKKFFMSIIL